MPSLSPITILGDLAFIAKGKKLPVDWSQPQDTDCDGNTQYNAATSASDKAGVPTPMCYFFSASTNKYHTETAKKIGGQFKDFVHEAIDKTKMAVDMWRLQAKFKDLKVMSVSAIGTPGCLDGPKLKDCYVGWIGTESNENAYIKAVKESVPNATLIFDRFHVQRLVHDALDEVRRDEVRSAGSDEKTCLKKTRWPLQKRPWNLSGFEAATLADLEENNRPIYRAYLLKEFNRPGNFGELVTQVQPEQPECC